MLAELQTDGLTARREVAHHYSHGFADLVQFFDDLARDWRGWSGERDFWSLEGDLKLSAAHNGHVQLRVVLSQSTVIDGWRVEANLRLDPGEQLSRVARDLRDVVESDGEVAVLSPRSGTR